MDVDVASGSDLLGVERKQDGLEVIESQSKDIPTTLAQDEVDQGINDADDEDERSSTEDSDGNSQDPDDEPWWVALLEDNLRPIIRGGAEDEQRVRKLIEEFNDNPTTGLVCDLFEEYVEVQEVEQPKKLRETMLKLLAGSVVLTDRCVMGCAQCAQSAQSVNERVKLRAEMANLRRENEKLRAEIKVVGDNLKKVEESLRKKTCGPEEGTMPHAFRPPIQGRVLDLDTNVSFAAPSSGTRKGSDISSGRESLERLLVEMLPRILGKMGVPVGAKTQKKDKDGGKPKIISVEVIPPPLPSDVKRGGVKSSTAPQRITGKEKGSLRRQLLRQRSDQEDTQQTEKTPSKEVNKVLVKESAAPSYAGATKTARQAVAEPAMAGKEGAVGAKRKAPTRSVVPRTSAIMISGPPDGPRDQYAVLMREARAKIRPEDLGIESIRSKRAITGAFMLEIPGKDCGPKADQLADRLREVFAQKPGVKISRPMRMTDLRLRRIEDSISEEEVREAIAAQCCCQKDLIRIGKIRRFSEESGTVWLRCPVTTANMLARDGLRIGWGRVRAEILRARPVQCFRCLEVGHVGATCTSQVDRSSFCYRCGEPGHMARSCEGAIKCPVCKERGMPYGHKIGAVRAGCTAVMTTLGNRKDSKPVPKPSEPSSSRSAANRRVESDEADALSPDAGPKTRKERVAIPLVDSDETQEESMM